MTTDEGVKADEDTKKIVEWFRGLKNERDTYITKARLREAYDLPATRAVRVWAKLNRLGYTDDGQKIWIPANPQAKEQKEKQKAERTEENDLDSVLND